MDPVVRKLKERFCSGEAEEPVPGFDEGYDRWELSQDLYEEIADAAWKEGLSIRQLLWEVVKRFLEDRVLARLP